MNRSRSILNALLCAGALAATIPGCAAEDVGPSGQPEITTTDDRPPTDEEQRAEQARRAELVRDIEPARWDGWVADGTARFATVDPDLVDAEPRKSRGTAEEGNDSVLVLADGRRYVQKGDAYLAPLVTLGRPSATEDAGDPVLPRAQIGADGRVRTATADYTKYPYRAVGTIMSKSTDASGWCTATMIGPRVAITAGHCVYNPNSNAWSWNTWFSPGHRGQGSDRFPNGTPRAVVGLLSFHGWSVDEDPDHDVGFLILADEPQTAALGWFGFGWWSDPLDGIGVSMFQYPGASYSCAASPLAGHACGGFQYWGTSSINNECGNLLEHQVDTNPGSSGSPTYRWWNGGRWIIGPHAYGFSPCDSGDNKAVRMGKYKAGVACQLMKDFPSIWATRDCG